MNENTNIAATSSQAEISPWKVLPGDEVQFVLKQGVSFDKALTGKVLYRDEKTATVHTVMDGIDKTFRVHVFCLKITKPVVRLGQLKGKFAVKKANSSKQKSFSVVEHKVGDMVFSHKRQSR